MKAIIFFITTFLFLFPLALKAQKVLEYKRFHDEGKELAAAGKYEAALLSYDKAIETMPYYSAIYYDRAIAKIKTKDYNGALMDLNAVLEKKPYDSKAYLQRGIAYYHLQDYYSAEADIDQVLADTPYHREALFYQKEIAREMDKLRQEEMAQIRQNELVDLQRQQLERQDRRMRRRQTTAALLNTILPLAILTAFLIWR